MADRTITIDLDTGEWVTPITITSEESKLVAASVLPGITPRLVDTFYRARMSADPPPDRGVVNTTGELIAFLLDFDPDTPLAGHYDGTGRVFAASSSIADDDGSLIVAIGATSGLNPALPASVRQLLEPEVR